MRQSSTGATKYFDSFRWTAVKMCLLLLPLTQCLDLQEDRTEPELKQRLIRQQTVLGNRPELRWQLVMCHNGGALRACGRVQVTQTDRTGRQLRVVKSALSALGLLRLDADTPPLPWPLLLVPMPVL
jgi:hypothetical protein